MDRDELAALDKDALIELIVRLYERLTELKTGAQRPPPGGARIRPGGEPFGVQPRRSLNARSGFMTSTCRAGPRSAPRALVHPQGGFAMCWQLPTHSNRPWTEL